ncbi:aldehyde dehydrogenase family protein [Laribacter hongkongensis]|uniref:aldehyde dehydrogenase family protein n=1 Tax=Laribacter hongkongensis TaxID=168471 RepID=UPI001EFC54C7|nr:aldehyde dehydrogenase family protein [Laribacter hongkongensis]MCG9114550.1 aldehyde dehydrogenase family protein [Laribacter hongkongensis]
MNYHSCNPATGEVVHTRASWSADRLAGCLDALREAQSRWHALPVEARCERLRRLGDGLLAARTTLAPLITLEVGKLLAEADAEIEKTARLCHYYADLAPPLLRPQSIPTAASRSGVSFEPLGLVFAVMPWNYPVWQAMRFAVPALAAGNACLVKPAPTVPQSSHLLLELARDAGLDVFDLAWIDNPDAEAAIAASNGLAFTGSTATGRHLATLAGRHLKKSVLELGGSNPVIVLKDADVELAAREAATSRFRDAGQSCNAAKRMILVPEIADAFIEAFMHEVARRRTGDPCDPATQLAPMHRADLRQTLHEQVEDAVAHGARLLCGGRLPAGAGFYYPATVLENVPPAARLYREEAFGPVASLYRVDNEADAVRVANDTPYGLGATIYSADDDRAARLAARLEVGSVFINRHTSSDLRLPFGGVKDSGYGRELSEFGLYEFVNVKTFWQR